MTQIAPAPAFTPSAPLLHVASEVFPFSRTGGLADVVSALPQAQAGAGLEVAVLSPWYADLQAADGAEEVREVWRGKLSGVGEAWLGETRLGGVRYLFIGLEDFQRSGLYHDDDVQRFCRSSRAVLPALGALGLQPALLHAHDWQAGLALSHAALAGIPTVFTVHNLQYQGRWSLHEAAAWTGLPDWALSPDYGEFYGDLNLLKLGLTFAGHATTVSPSYAREITTPEYGEGLQGVLARLQAEGRLSGILNGLDLERWNPRTDPHIRRFSKPTAKASARKKLREMFGFDKRPVLAVVSRLADQKGMDALLLALPKLVENWNVVILGGGDALLEAAFEGWSHHAGVAFATGMNEPLAHQIYAGADAFAMPSRFEPCGLSQMIALRYGTLPIVRATGGLADTVLPDIGFVFEGAVSGGAVSGAKLAEGLLSAAAQALATWGNKAEWRSRMEAGMALDFSWDASAAAYAQVYGMLMEDR